MIDLIDRLRSKTPNMTEGHAAMEEAAATIEDLRARLARADELADFVGGYALRDPDVNALLAAYRATGGAA